MVLGRLFGKLKQGLAKTRNVFSGVFDLFTGNRRVDKDFLAKLEEQLYLADVGVQATAQIVDRVRQGFLDREVGEDVKVFVRQQLRDMLADPEGGIRWQPAGPTVVMIAGVNGSGKTTSIAKLANRLKADGRKVLVAACDTFRAAAVEQLSVWCDRIGVDIVKQQQGSDPAAVAHDACERAKARGYDALIVDTAGRLHTKQPLMEELKKVRRVLEKAAGHVDEVLLVLDATTGQNGIAQARAFAEAVDVTGVVLTKLDGTARGGIVLAVREELGVPVKLVGVGEGAEDLIPFDPDAFAHRLVA
jgi:fused signal recognition particle receptor